MNSIPYPKYGDEQSWLISVAEAARMCGVSRAMMYQLVHSKAIPQPIKIGKRTLFSREVLEMWTRLQCPHGAKMESLVNSAIRKRARKRSKDLADSYVRQVLCAGSRLLAKDVPQELVDTKREHLRNKRLLKEM